MVWFVTAACFWVCALVALLPWPGKKHTIAKVMWNSFLRSRLMIWTRRNVLSKLKPFAGLKLLQRPAVTNRTVRRITPIYSLRAAATTSQRTPPPPPPPPQPDSPVYGGNGGVQAQRAHAPYMPSTGERMDIGGAWDMPNYAVFGFQRTENVFGRIMSFLRDFGTPRIFPPRVPRQAVDIIGGVRRTSVWRIGPSETIQNVLAQWDGNGPFVIELSNPIAAGAITAGEIADGTIRAENLLVGTINMPVPPPAVQTRHFRRGPAPTAMAHFVRIDDRKTISFYDQDGELIVTGPNTNPTPLGPEERGLSYRVTVQNQQGSHNVELNTQWIGTTPYPNTHQIAPTPLSQMLAILTDQFVEPARPNRPLQNGDTVVLDPGPMTL